MASRRTADAAVPLGVLRVLPKSLAATLAVVSIPSTVFLPLSRRAGGPQLDRRRKLGPCTWSLDSNELYTCNLWYANDPLGDRLKSYTSRLHRVEIASTTPHTTLLRTRIAYATAQKPRTCSRTSRSEGAHCRRFLLPPLCTAVRSGPIIRTHETLHMHARFQRSAYLLRVSKAELWLFRQREERRFSLVDGALRLHGFDDLVVPDMIRLETHADQIDARSAYCWDSPLSPSPR